jgi:hypothetical protein
MAPSFLVEGFAHVADVEFELFDMLRYGDKMSRQSREKLCNTVVRHYLDRMVEGRQIIKRL